MTTKISSNFCLLKTSSKVSAQKPVISEEEFTDRSVEFVFTFLIVLIVFMFKFKTSLSLFRLDHFFSLSNLIPCNLKRQH